MAKPIQKGEAIILEVEFEKKIPFKGFVLNDPASPTVTVTDPNNAVVVNAAPLVRDSTGKWSYVVFTQTSWVVGDYSATIASSDIPTSNAEKFLQAFALI